MIYPRYILLMIIMKKQSQTIDTHALPSVVTKKTNAHFYGKDKSNKNIFGKGTLSKETSSSVIKKMA